jgi:Domain of unknown function (DUF4157)
MSQARTSAAAPPQVQHAPRTGEHDQPAEVAADRYAAYAVAGRAAEWSFGHLPLRDPGGGAALLRQRLDGDGHALPDELASTLGGGLDLTGVRLHTGADAAALARSEGAEAVTAGSDIAFAAGRFETHTLEGRHRVAHELAHAAAHRRHDPQGVHHRKEGETTTAPAKADYEMFVDEAVRYLTSAADYYHSMAQVAKAAGVTPPQAPDPAKPAEAPAATPPKQPKQPEQPAGKADRKATPGRTPTQPGLDDARLTAALKKLTETYDSSRTILEQQLGGDANRTDRLRRAYVDAAGAARAAAAGTARANLIVIAAPKEQKDLFIVNATTYARQYYAAPRGGEVVTTIKDVDSVDALLDAIEGADPNRMIGRIDVFCHGTIEPVHELKLGKTWHPVKDFETAAQARAGRAATLSTHARFDAGSVIELHACRLGAPLSDIGKTKETPTTGTDFLTGVGRSLGGEQGESVTGYQQRWVPRRFQFPGLTKVSDLKPAQRTTFDRIAVQTYDAVMAGSTEVRNLLTDDEVRTGTVSRARKVAIMERLYDDAGGAWVIGHQYAGTVPQSIDPVKDVKGKRDTFSNEADWQSLTLTVTIPKPPAPTGGTP